jgi:hypothetical protein
MRFSSIVKYAVEVVVLAAALTLLGIGALALQPTAWINLIYPATDLGAAILWGFGFRWWPVVFLAQFALSYNINGFRWIPFFVGANELMVTALFYWTMKRFHVSRDLDRLRDLGIFTLAALLRPRPAGSRRSRANTSSSRATSRASSPTAFRSGCRTLSAS